MYSRSYNKNTPFTVPRQYSGVAFSRPKESEGTRAQSPFTKPPTSYSREAGERLYAPGDLPKINIPVPHQEEVTEEKGSDRKDEKELEAAERKHSSFLTSLGSLGDDTLMLIALILLLSGCEEAGDTVMVLIMLLLLG